MSIHDATPGAVYDDPLPNALSPKGTPELWRLDRISGIVGEIAPPVTMFVTASEWARIAREVERLGSRPNPQNFRQLILRSLIVVNSGSEDEEAVWLLNQPEAERCGFAWKRDNWISGKLH